MLGVLLGPGKRTVTDLICSRGGQQADWTADYRLYSKKRVDESVLFGRVRDSVLEALPQGAPLVVGLDDTVVSKTGTKIHGCGWKRDPLGPPFQTNLIRAQRYLQFSAAWPLEDGQARMVPIDFVHAPSPVKPGKKADDAQLKDWQEVEAFASGKRHKFRIKTIGPVLWRKAGAKLSLRLVVIAPIGYRLRKGSKMLYRQPAYLFCTDPDLPVEELLQDYLWRWGIEVNFREEKALLGTGEAQVRTAPSNQHLPAMTVAAYSMLWTAALNAYCGGVELPCWKPPKWREQPESDRRLPSTGELLRLLRIELWAGAIRPDSFYDFVTHSPPDMNAEKLNPSLPSMLFDAA